MSKASIDWVLKNRFYIGEFKWGGETYAGTHPLFIDRKTFEAVQAVFAGHNRPKYGSQEIAFRGLVNCAYDGCTVTGEIKKEKYIYYHCTDYRGKCDLPHFKEEELATRLGEPLKHLQVPPRSPSRSSPRYAMIRSTALARSMLSGRAWRAGSQPYALGWTLRT